MKKFEIFILIIAFVFLSVFSFNSYQNYKFTMETKQILINIDTTLNRIHKQTKDMNHHIYRIGDEIDENHYLDVNIYRGE